MRSTSSFVFKRIEGLHGSGGDQTSPPTLYGRADDNTTGRQVNFIGVRSAVFRPQAPAAGPFSDIERLRLKAVLRTDLPQLKIMTRNQQIGVWLALTLLLALALYRWFNLP
jgi:hypothetical protein